MQACLNGARSPREHPALPVTAVELAADAQRVRDVGATGVHVHVKDAAGTDTLDPRRTDDVVAAVRAVVPGLEIGLTTGAWAQPDPTRRLAAIASWTELPDVASVNWHEPGAEDIAQCLLERGIGVEAGLWHEAAVEAWSASPHRHRCLRVLLELPGDVPPTATVAAADYLLGLVAPVGIPVLIHGEDLSCWPALAHAARLGLPTRVGLEDTLVMSDGSPAADNAALVEAALAVAASGSVG